MFPTSYFNVKTSSDLQVSFVLRPVFGFENSLHTNGFRDNGFRRMHINEYFVAFDVHSPDVIDG